MKNRLFLLSLFFVTASCSHMNSRSPASVPMSDIDWPYYASDAGSSKFSSANQVNKSNVKALKPAWLWNSIDNDNQKSKATAYNESTPIMVDGVLFTSTSLNQVAALDPATGQAIWTFDPKAYIQGTPPNSGFVHRGVSYWNNGDKKRIIYGTNEGYLLSLDAETGLLDKNFGTHGSVDLTQGLGRPVERRKYAVTSPAMICRDTVIVGASISDFVYNKDTAPGDIRGFDVQTGKLKWTFHTIPHAGEPGVETWEKNSWQHTGQANVWTTMSADLELGAVYLPVSTPADDYYGGERPGNGLFGESLVSLNCSSGKMNWYFQLVHHGLWDYDPPAAPTLMDLSVRQADGSLKNVKAVAQVTKQAFVYAFNRETGEPIWPIVETPVPQSDVASEKSSPTQPIPSKPAPFDRQGISLDDLIDFTPKLREQAVAILESLKYGKLFTPPGTDKSTVLMPGLVGGASWAGAAYNPITQRLYVPSVTAPYKLGLTKPWTGDYKYKFGLMGSGFLLGPEGLPLSKPPYGRITAINMSTGNNAWVVPAGRGPKDHSALKDARLPSGDLGWDRRTHVLLTPEILFTAQAGTFSLSVDSLLSPNSTPVTITDDDPALKALDPDTGETLAKFSLPSNAWAAPITYIYQGKQYVVVPYGGANLKAGLAAFALE